MADAPLIRRVSPEGKVKSGRLQAKSLYATPEAVLTFWFGCPDDPDYGQNKARWWTADDAFDAAVRRHFLTTWQAAGKGKLDGWAVDARGTLALILVLDQFSRNLQRGSAATYAHDASALQWALHAIAQGWDQQLPLLQRAFLYLPLEHAEDVALQRQALELFTPYRDVAGLENFYTSAVTHCDVVTRFGRFPHRNALFGRSSTPEELAYLAANPRGY
ncbi:DUF924 family protein [Silvimonas sp. JCM 19000]